MIPLKVNRIHMSKVRHRQGQSTKQKSRKRNHPIRETHAQQRLHPLRDRLLRMMVSKRHITSQQEGDHRRVAGIKSLQEDIEQVFVTESTSGGSSSITSSIISSIISRISSSSHSKWKPILLINPHNQPQIPTQRGLFQRVEGGGESVGTVTGAGDGPPAEDVVLVGRGVVGAVLGQVSEVGGPFGGVVDGHFAVGGGHNVDVEMVGIGLDVFWEDGYVGGGVLGLEGLEMGWEGL
jgi:hypothetical protein